MKMLKTGPAIIGAVFVGTLVAARLFAADPTPNNPPTGAPPNEAEMMKQMMEMGEPGDNHKLLAQLAGTWNYTVKFWMAPGMPPSQSKGEAVSTMGFGGRYLLQNATGRMEMPDASGKVKEMQFKGMGIEGYDNAKKKFFGTWIDNMGTGIMMSEGTYDPATKTFTYTGDEEMVPGTVTKVRETLQITDKDHHIMQWYENRGGQETKTMEISYTRKK